ncbi:SufE family protein [Agrococcus sp. SGAir0287]|uniref:SufE family protein n=1 Tax=Agrococcus sp. SGAir0287 TaxID=2070347 RepID=UPI0010CCF89B|nr:SufE family protein [Agrococcus sp. SGAir0287]QCR19350.1 cysteine desulfuration protein SufE [Agrococcus sp. SGAir0287]
MSLTPTLQEFVDDFAAVGEQDRLMLLLDHADALPELPPRYADHPDLLERVLECQSPVFLFVEVDAGLVHVHATAPVEAPTTRGFASILVRGLDGATVEAALAVPADLSSMLGLERAVSPLRLRGMSGMLGRIQRQIRERVAEA